MRNRMYWGLAILIILLIGVGCALLIQRTDTEPTEQILKPPPEGETFATGHWNGDKWHRTVPKNPETITYNGEKLTLRELYEASFNKSWEEEVEILNRIIAEAPYSKHAYYARKNLARRDENGKSIYDNDVLFERFKPLLKYNPNSPALLHDLLRYRRRSHPEEAIRYGKEALTYVEMYPVDSGYHQYTESIHHLLGSAYERIGDYDTALEHYNQVLLLYRAYPDRTRSSQAEYLVRGHIEQIRKGNPVLGPLSDGSVQILPERAPKPVKGPPSEQDINDKNKTDE